VQKRRIAARLPYVESEPIVGPGMRMGSSGSADGEAVGTADEGVTMGSSGSTDGEAVGTADEGVTMGSSGSADGKAVSEADERTEDVFR
jgi:hypothetical protein